MSAVASKAGTSDRRILLILGGTMIAILVIVSLLAKSSEDNDPRPTTYNAGTAGAKAAFLVLERLGRPVTRWDQPLHNLDSVPAERTTLVLAEPQFSVQRRKAEAADLQRFLERGGRVLLTGPTWASLLPGGQTAPPGPFRGEICYTTPEGPGELARAGEVEMADHGAWAGKGPLFRVEQRCGKDAVVVRFPVGKGEAVWWSSSTPLTNAGLRKVANLKLLLASLYGNGGQARQVLFDEYVQVPHGDGESVTRGLPLHWLLAQLGVAFLLLVLSFSRRKGPLRMPVELPRSSPVEFASSMGDLYEKAGATSAATEAARRRLLRLLQRDAGVGRAAVEQGPEAIADALHSRLRGDWSSLAGHLRDAQNASHEAVQPRSALALVRALGEDEVRVREALRPAMAIKIVEGDHGTLA